MAAEVDETALSHYVWQTIRILCACALSYGLAKAAALHEEYWALITAVVVTQPAWGDTLAASRDRVLGTLLGAAAGFLVLEAAQHGASAFYLFWCALVPLAVVTALRQNLRLSCITLIIVVLVPGTGSAFARPVDRVLGIMLGTIAALVVVSGARLLRQRWA